MKPAIAAAILLAAPGLTPGLAFADDWAEAARGELQFVELTLANEGWTLDREFHAGGLSNNESGYQTMVLDDRDEYLIAALCDEHCGDIDLALYNDEGMQIGADCAQSGLPVVQVMPDTRARFDLEVRMFNCAEDECRYSVALFSRPGRTAMGSR